MTDSAGPEPAAQPEVRTVSASPLAGEHAAAN